MPSMSDSTVTYDMDTASKNLEMIIPPFIYQSSEKLAFYSYAMESRRRPDGKVVLNYNIVFDKQCANNSETVSSDKSTKSTDISSDDTLLKKPSISSLKKRRTKSLTKAKASTSSTTSIKSAAFQIIDMINVTIVIHHYAPTALYDEDQKIDLPSPMRKKKARTIFTHEFNSTTTIREVLGEFFEEMKTRLGGDVSPELSYSSGKPDNKERVLTKKMMDCMIGTLAEDREKFTIFVNGTKKEAND